MPPESVHDRFSAALEALVKQIKRDRSVLAAVLCGSLSHDTVWDKSDVDLVLVTIDDKKVGSSERALYADGVNVHALLVPRSEFRQMVEGAVRNSFLHSFLAKGRLLYTHDESLAELVATLVNLGERDTRLRLLSSATRALGPLYKARKWLITRGDLDYSALWILYTATPLAEIEVLSARLLADREVIPQAMKLNPSFFKTVYTEILNRKKTTAAVKAALDAIERYLAERAEKLFAPILEHLREVGEARSATELDDHFQRHLGITSVIAACEYLADEGWIGKSGTTVQLTRKSNATVQELAFFHAAGKTDRHGF